MAKNSSNASLPLHSQASQRLGNGSFFNNADVVAADDDDGAASNDGCFAMFKRLFGRRRRSRSKRANASRATGLSRFERIDGADDIALSDVSRSATPAASSSSSSSSAMQQLQKQLDAATATHNKHVENYDKLGAQACRERAANRPQQALIVMRKRAAVKASIDMSAKLLDEIAAAQLRLEQIDATNEHVKMQRLLVETTRGAIGDDASGERLIQTIHDTFTDADEVADQVDRIQGTLASALNLAAETRPGPCYDDDELLRELAALAEPTVEPTPTPAPLQLPAVPSARRDVAVGGVLSKTERAPMLEAF